MTVDELTMEYLRKFRKARTEETLEVMAAGAEKKAPTSHQSAIAKAFVLREKELGVLL